MASALSLSSIPSISYEELAHYPCQLVKTKSEEWIVRFPEGLKGKFIWNDHYLLMRESLKNYGIKVPVRCIGSYNTQYAGRILMKSHEFTKAFFEIYVPNTLTNMVKWIKYDPIV